MKKTIAGFTMAMVFGAAPAAFALSCDEGQQFESAYGLLEFDDQSVPGAGTPYGLAAVDRNYTVFPEGPFFAGNDQTLENRIEQLTPYIGKQINITGCVSKGDEIFKIISIDE